MKTERKPAGGPGRQPTERWQHFDHGADIGVRGIGPTKEAAFAEAARGLTAVMTDLATVRANEAIRVRCEAPDDVLLLVEFLNHLIYEMATRDMLFHTFEVTFSNHRLDATMWGESVDRGRHQPAVEPKGATLTCAEVGVRDGHWFAQCVVDV